MGNHFRRGPQLASVYDAQSFAERMGGQLFGNNAVGAVLQCFRNGHLIISVSQEQDFCPRTPGVPGGEVLQTLWPQQPNVAQQNGWVDLLHKVDRLTALRAFADDLKVWRCGQKPTDPCPEQWLIVREQNGDGRRLAHTALEKRTTMLVGRCMTPPSA
jgi:hypothetical protein